jgi:limonene 1,2-monooxygenase
VVAQPPPDEEDDMDRLRFGTFLAPLHPAGENPTLALQRDLELVEHLDRLGYDEAWIGEHHSAGTELIASPEIFIAAAAERTKRIKLGTGVTSIAYHNPLWVAERMVLLDHIPAAGRCSAAGQAPCPPTR